MSSSLEVTPQTVRANTANQVEQVIVDVREAEEVAFCHIEGSVHIPMGSVPSALQQLESAADRGPLMVFCHHGVRSLQVVNWLRQQGIDQCFSVAGGIDRWSAEIDPAVPRY